MKSVMDALARLRAANGSHALTEADVIREVQSDAYASGYAQAARDMLGIALESQERVDQFLSRASAVGVVDERKLAS